MFGGTEGVQNVLSEKKNSRKAVTGFLQNDEKVELVGLFGVCNTSSRKHSCDISSGDTSQPSWFPEEARNQLQMNLRKQVSGRKCKGDT